jgi:hypothetical protein
MRIGIITLSASDNYGAMLQAFALQEYIKSLGHETYIIDYLPEYKLRNYRPFILNRWLSKSPIKTLRKIKDEAPKYPCRVLRHKRALKFRNTYFNLYPYTQGMDFHEFDAIVLGSDQIWNPQNTNNCLEDIYWGVGANCKVVSYAPSMGRASLDKKDVAYVSMALENMNNISVRESSMIDVLQPLTKKTITQVIDPTFLLSRDNYEPLVEEPRIDKPYMLLFDLFERPSTLVFALKFAEKNNCKLIRLQGAISAPFWRKDVVQTATVGVFLGLIKAAKCVITSSFHGMAFSIIFNKPFYSIRQHSQIDLRAESILDKIGLKDRMVDDTCDIVFTGIDYNPVMERISDVTSISKEYLLQAFS